MTITSFFVFAFYRTVAYIIPPCDDSNMYITIVYLLSLVLHRVADKRLAKEPDCSIRFDCNHCRVVRVDENSDLILV